jgi:hypothetical protein
MIKVAVKKLARAQGSIIRDKFAAGRGGTFG